MKVVNPELVTGRDDGFVHGPWMVIPGSTRRGEASCNLSDRILEVPLGADPASRVVRAHELMHARVSPHRRDHWGDDTDISPRALECAEEFRVNTLVARLDFDVALLRDGSEKGGGRHLAEGGEWPETLCFLLAVLGTGAEKEFLAGVRQGDPSWLPGLRAVRKCARAHMDELETSALGATRLGLDGVPQGFARGTVELARIITHAMGARPPRSSDEVRTFRRSLQPGGRRAPSGRFAVLNFDASVVMASRPRGPGVRRIRPSNTGTTMRYPGRLLTDDLKRAFALRTTSHGGIVVIDQSGSMDIDEGQLVRLVGRAPDALVVGYSHRPGDLANTPNAWILASRGAVARECPSGNVGNGVDGPILEWAIERRTGHEPIVWVTDGQITDSNDHPDEGLTRECALLVRRHRIRLVRELVDAGRSLTRLVPPSPSSWASFGRLGREMLAIMGK